MRPSGRRDGIGPGGGDACWLAVGDGAAAALEDHWRRASGGDDVAILEADDVHDALTAFSDRPITGCVVSARVLDARPRAALQNLKSRLGLAPLMVLDVGEDEDACRIARDLGVIVLEATAAAVVSPPEAPPEAPAEDAPPEPHDGGGASGDGLLPLPRADEDAPSTDIVDAGRFAAGCLERIGKLGSLVRYILRTLSEVSNAGRISLMLKEPERGTLCLRAGRGIEERLIGKVRCAIGTGIAGRVAALGRPAQGHGSSGGPRGYRSSAYVVLPLGRGRACEGVVSMTALPGGRVPSEHVVRAWAQIGRHAGLALRSARRMQRARSLSTVDGLTRLPNRRAFERALHRELERARRNGTRLVVGIVDVDHFKSFNDRHGHATGDRVLREVARRLGAAFRETDLVARWGGEEFAVLLPGLERGEEADREPQRAMERARGSVGTRPFTLGEGLPSARVTISGGYALFPDDGERGDVLLKLADEALYRAKDGGRDRMEPA